MREGRARIDDVSIDYVETGDGAPLILVHGALADLRMWAPIMEELAARHRVLAPTQRHFGPRGSAHAGGFGVETHARDLIALIRTLGLGPCALAGWSYGADVALRALSLEPATFDHALLVEPGFPGLLEGPELEAFSADAKEVFGPVFGLVADGALEAAVETLIDGSGGAPGTFRDQPAEHRRQQMENAHTLPKQLAQSEEPRIDRVTVNRIAARTHVAWGSATRPLFRLVSQAAARHIPGASAHVLEGATHLFPLAQPALFASEVHRALRTFVSRT